MFIRAGVFIKINTVYLNTFGPFLWSGRLGGG